jgi:hypothetical protein
MSNIVMLSFTKFVCAVGQSVNCHYAGCHYAECKKCRMSLH